MPSAKTQVAVQNPTVDNNCNRAVLFITKTSEYKDIIKDGTVTITGQRCGRMDRYLLEAINSEDGMVAIHVRNNGKEHFRSLGWFPSSNVMEIRPRSVPINKKGTNDQILNITLSVDDRVIPINDGKKIILPDDITHSFPMKYAVKLWHERNEDIPNRVNEWTKCNISHGIWAYRV